jgi:SAM-dependent methyltransferase
MIEQLTNFLRSLGVRFPESLVKERLLEFIRPEIKTERVVEYPLTLQALADIRDGRILDVGCRYSRLPIQLASLGYQVWGIDIHPCGIRHPNFTFIRGDIRHADLPKRYFDAVISISALEHIGLSFYGESKDLMGDKTALESMKKLLKSNGRMVLSFPFGKKGEGVFYRVYGDTDLKEMRNGLRILSEEFFKKTKDGWVKASLNEVINLDSSKKVKAIAFVVWQNREGS